MFVKVYPMFVKRYAKLFQPKPNNLSQCLTIYKVIMSIYDEFHQRNGSLSKTMDYEDQDVVTLTLGSQPRQRLVKVQAKYEARKSHFMLLRVQKSVRE